jgi:hypothetical protein
MWGEDARLPDFAACYTGGQEGTACQPRSIIKPLAVAVMDVGTVAKVAVGFADQPAPADPRAAFVKHLRCLVNARTGAWEQNASAPLCTKQKQMPGNAYQADVVVCPGKAELT